MSKKWDIDFWKNSTKKTFNETRKELQERSEFTDDEIKEMLECLYYAVSEEYGN